MDEEFLEAICPRWKRAGRSVDEHDGPHSECSCDDCNHAMRAAALMVWRAFDNDDSEGKREQQCR